MSTEEKKESTFAPKPKTENALKEIPVKKASMTDEEVWLRVYCAAVSGNVNAASQAKAIATNGLAEFKAQFK